MAHLVFQTAFPGDLFLSIPLIKRIRAWDPEAELVLACRPGLGDVFTRFNLVDRVLEVNKKSEYGRTGALNQLLAEHWQTVFVPHQSPRTALWMLRVRAERKVGFQKWWNGIVYSQRVVRPTHLPDALRQLALLAPLDRRVAEYFATEDVQDLANPESQASPFAFTTPPVPEWASMKLVEHQPDGKTVFLAPGSVWATKRWTQSGYEDLARMLLRRGFSVAIIGSPAEAALCAEIAAAVPGVASLAGKTSLADLVERLSTGVALICNDSGAMHAAAAADLPTVAIFGPTTLALGFRPWNTRSVVVQRELGCRPCGRHGHDKCPIQTHECMTEIRASQVIAALEKLVR